MRNTLPSRPSRPARLSRQNRLSRGRSANGRISVATIQAWWETEAGRARLEYELKALSDADIPTERDEASFERGVARLIVHPVVSGRREKMFVTFSDSYPYFRFIVTAPDLALKRHQHPFGKNLCLIGRSSDNWRTTDTVADLLASQLQTTIDAGLTQNRTGFVDLEEPQAEPFSDYYPYSAAMVQVDSAWRIPSSSTKGDLVLGIVGLRGTIERSPPQLQAIALEIRDHTGALHGEVAPALRERYGSEILRARWTRAQMRIESDDAAEVFRLAAQLDAKGSAPQWSAPASDPKGETVRYQVRGVLFPEEGAASATTDGWVFVVALERARQTHAAVAGPQGPRKGFRTPPKQKAVGHETHYYFARAGRSGEADLLARIPELSELKNATVAVFGAGCIGAPSILEFARAGVKELRILDNDIVDPGATVRWPFGMSMGGRFKVEVLADQVAEHYPYTRVVPIIHEIGAVRASRHSEAEILNLMLDGAHLIYDATAEPGVQRFLAEIARRRGLAYIAVSGTQGGWGGIVTRIRPQATRGCWLCSQLDEALPVPSAKNIDGVQPTGCANPTFTGAGFDMSDVALHAVRLAVSTLSNGKEGGYPSANWDIAVISHRSVNGTELLPSVSVHDLNRHPACPECQPRYETAASRAG